jgi:hypothetical protein
MLIKASDNNLIRGLCTQEIPGGVVSLQYADDTILFVHNDIEMARNLKWVLTCFEQASGMKINYSKSELVPINLDQSKIDSFRDILECVVGSFPIKYPGIPLHYEKKLQVGGGNRRLMQQECC